MTKVTPVEHAADLFGELVHVPGIPLDHRAEGHTGDEGRDEARSAERVRDAVGEGSASGRDHLTPGAVDQVLAAGVDDHGSDQERGGDAADDAVADLIQNKRRPGSPAGDRGLDVRGRHGGKEQRHADPVVEPAFDIQALADPPRHAAVR